jgi:DNA replication protein DnaC
MLKKTLVSLKMKGALSVLDSLNTIQNKDEFAIALLQAELNYRHQKALERGLKAAAFPIEKVWNEIDHTLNPRIDFKSIQALGSGEFIQRKENVCLMGGQGTGKSHSLIALGTQLCEEGYSVKFYTACSLVIALEEAKAMNQLSQFMKSILKPQLLVIDELGFVPFTETGARLLFDVFSRRYENGSIAVSTNLSFEKWVQVFGSVELTAALVDRFTHKAHNFVFDGDSIRFLEATGQRKKVIRFTKPDG